MPDRKPPGGESLYRGPSRAPRDKRERERDRQARPHRDGEPPRPKPPLRDRIPDLIAPEPSSPRVPREQREQRIYGLNACLAVFAKRPESVRKVWLLESRIPKLK